MEGRSALGAQVAIEAGPSIGYYAPLGSSDGVNIPANFPGPALGAELTLWSAHRFGVRGDATFAAKAADKFVNPGGWDNRLAGQITMASVLATYDISPERLHTVWLAAGPGVIHHGGDAFARSGHPTNAAGVLAIGSSLQLAKTVGLTLGASAFLYDYSGIFGAIGGPPAVDGSVSNGYLARHSQKDLIVYGAFAWIRP